MIAAVTGGTGFIGKKLVERLVERGNVVRMITRKPASFEKSPLIEICDCDLVSVESKSLFAMLDGVEVLYHCAGQLRDDRLMRALHVDATSKLVEAAAGRIGHWVQLSSVGVYGQVTTGVVTEDSLPNPVGQYEITKAASDRIVFDAADKGWFSCSILRPSNVFGAGMTNQSLFNLIAMIERGLFFYIGRPGASANYIHVDNVIEGLLRCGTMPQAKGRTYNLSDHCTMERFIAIIARALGKDAPRLRLPESVVRAFIKLLGNIPGVPLTEARVNALTSRAVYSNTKIERELGYRHQVTMEKGLLELLASWRQQRQ
jgi:nucleoside-diphosphate-sugar epimerase